MGFHSDNDPENPGLGLDLLYRPGWLQPATGLGATLMQGMRTGAIPAPVMAPDAPEPPVAAQAATPSPRLTDQNVNRLAVVLKAECQGTCNDQELRGVGSTVINRMNRNGTDSVADVTGHKKYAVSDKPDAAMLETARQLLSGQMTDNTGGATHFYSPGAMPKLGQNTKKYDIGGGTELIPGHTAQNWRPGFAVKYPQNVVPWAHDWVVKFYTQPGTGRVH